MSITRFRPEIWSARLLVANRKALVFGSPTCVNRDYEGDIAAAGDTVRITSISRPTVSTYVPNSTTITPQALTDAQRTLVVDQVKYFAFEVDDVDARQAAGNVMPQAMDESAFALADVMDQFYASFYTGVQSANQLGTVSITSGDLAYQYLVKLKRKLDEANVTSQGRYVIITPWYLELLLNNTNFINAEKAADSGIALREGSIGRAAGFDIMLSNNCVNITGDDWVIQAGVSSAITVAEQINKVEAFRPQSSFSDAVKGLQLYGAKLVRPDSLATLYASQT